MSKYYLKRIKQKQFTCIYCKSELILDESEFEEYKKEGSANVICGDCGEFSIKTVE